MGRFIHPLLDNCHADGKLKSGVLTNGTFEAGLEMPLLDREFDEADDSLYAAPFVPDQYSSFIG